MKLKLKLKSEAGINIINFNGWEKLWHDIDVTQPEQDVIQTPKSYGNVTDTCMTL